MDNPIKMEFRGRVPILPIVDMAIVEPDGGISQKFENGISIVCARMSCREFGHETSKNCSTCAYPASESPGEAGDRFFMTTSVRQ
jgi:hypothetical protein